MLSILDIVEGTTVDGPGFRTAIYAAGCPNHCEGCHNPQSWDINNGRKISEEQLLATVLADPFSNVTFTGGDPMFQPEGFALLARKIKAHSNKDIWCYTGFTYEEILNNSAQYELLKNVDVLVDGKFVQELASEKLYFRGSSNQRIIDVKSSLRCGQVVLFEYDPLPKEVGGL